MDYDRNLPLYLSTNERFSISQATACIEKAYALGKPVLIYIHGRAKGIGEPKKSVNDNTYKDLVAYGTIVIGFTWDADDGGFDVSRPLASFDDFAEFLQKFSTFLQSHAVTPPSLLAHSMGNLLVAEAAKDDLLTNAQGTWLQNIILSAAAVKNKRHDQWLAKIQASKNIYITVNSHDIVLEFAGFLFRPNMLGKELKAPLLTTSQVHYVDVSALGINHHYFVPGGQEHKTNLKLFFSQLARGENIDLSTITTSAVEDGATIYKMINH